MSRNARKALFGYAPVIVFLLASTLSGCATSSADRGSASAPAGSAGSHVQVYGEIDVGYGYSRTTVQSGK